jgi:hypothetical protein
MKAIFPPAGAAVLMHLAAAAPQERLLVLMHEGSMAGTLHRCEKCARFSLGVRTRLREKETDDGKSSVVQIDGRRSTGIQ